jgi:hypothetical protein
MQPNALLFIREITDSAPGFIPFTGFRAAEINNCPKIAPDFGSDSRRVKERIIVLYNPCRNTETGPKDKQDRIIICFRGP